MEDELAGSIREIKPVGQADLLREIRGYVARNPLDWKRWKLLRRAILFQRRDRADQGERQASHDDQRQHRGAVAAVENREDHQE